MNECAQKHTYNEIDSIGMLPFGTVTLIYLIISGISRSLQIYIGKLSGENTIVTKVQFIHA